MTALRIKLPDDSSWPRPALESDPVSGAGWKARHCPDTLTRGEILQLAAIADAYGYLLCETTQKRRDYVCREMRAAILAEES
jgi:hypothetical protein